ncbi:metal tolerance protein 9-like [Gigantopelta aegis]|uniref:metal tolerance protein 9-like n=1 Tax=Gigantopelta aegis TaxID=1735272 RepID=UPI001B88D4DA|nr:metal tolerance protein 9-like [Gigantopelta aegis]
MDDNTKTDSDISDRHSEHESFVSHKDKLHSRSCLSLTHKKPSRDTLSGNGVTVSSTELRTHVSYDLHSLLGLAPSSRTRLDPSCSHSSCQNGMVCMAQVAPERDSIISDEIKWKIPISLFSSKKTEPKEEKLTRRIKAYYKAQSELITAFESIEQGTEVDHRTEAFILHQKRIASRLAQISFLMNFVLMVGKTIAVALSSSVSIISSLVDSAVDLLSGVVIWWTSTRIRKKDVRYPSGRTRLEPLAIVILSVIMSVASFQLIIESIQRIIGLSKHSDTIPQFEITTVIITVSTVVIKLILFLLCYFYRKKAQSASVTVLMQDHRNDVFSNSVAILCGYLGSQQFVSGSGNYNVVFIDPIGAIIIGVYILITWWITGSEQIKMLTGHTAKPDFLSKITWMCLNHHPKILLIDTVRAFHFGNNFLVEVDVVLPEEMSLWESHNIGETLQQRLEKLPTVERAFVHLDYEVCHRPEEEHKML